MCRTSAHMRGSSTLRHGLQEFQSLSIDNRYYQSDWRHLFKKGFIINTTINLTDKNGPICFSGQNSLRCRISPHVRYVLKIGFGLLGRRRNVWSKQGN